MILLSDLLQKSERKSFIDKQIMKITEQHLALTSIKENKEHSSNTISNLYINTELLHKINTLEVELDAAIDELCENAKLFWLGFTTEIFQTLKQEQVGFLFSDKIHSLTSIFKSVEDLKANKDSRLYYKMAMV